MIRVLTALVLALALAAGALTAPASGATLDTVKEVEKKLERLDALRALGRETGERLAALNALAEHVAI